jgi:hypothetical protein
MLFKEVVGRAVMVPPAHTELTALNRGVILVAMLTVLETEQPLLFVYVIVVEPLDTPVTKPVESTVATLVSEEVQGVMASGVPEPIN